MNVMVAPGLRVHICPKVATASISNAMHGSRYRHAFPEEEGDEYRWMCVRHPLDRLVSCWSFFCQSDTDQEITGQGDVLKLGYYYRMPFDEFLDIALDRHVENMHTREQIRFAGPHKMDCLCPLERLSEGWEALKKRFSYLTRPLLVTHKSQHGHWKDYFSSTQEQRALNVFAADLQLYEGAL